MKHLLDMVHHNPGEPPFRTRFLEPAHLRAYGFNGQVFKHINCVATYADTGVDCFPAGSPERAWLDQFTPGITQQIAAAKAAGLQVFYHVDLFVLPTRLVEHFRSEICDPATGRILLDRPRTLELHRVLFAELTRRFPEVDGYIVRVGETYLFDTPHHVGNGPIPRLGPAWTPDYLYAETLAAREPAEPRWSRAQENAYVTLIDFLRAEICERHARQLFFRTWDIFPDKLHARRDHYLAVAERVAPHPKLAFSIKHTALDFWRHVQSNPCLLQGRHPQIIEVQCQREYEGKGAYPNYVMAGVLDGFEENTRKLGLRELLGHPQIVGVYSWSRGGGWYGPYLRHELWPDLNAYVLAAVVRSPETTERAAFEQYATERLGLAAADVDRFRQLCLLSARAILLGRHCEAFDRQLQEAVLPTANWMRDDRLGGRFQLAPVLAWIIAHGRTAEVLAEKARAVALWQEIAQLAEAIRFPDAATGRFVAVSAHYGRLLFAIVEQGWRVLLAGAAGDRTGRYDAAEIRAAAQRYHALWQEYRELAAEPLCATLYVPRYFNLPGQPELDGLGESVDHYLQLASGPAGR
jgi:hypothetical protein